MTPGQREMVLGMLQADVDHYRGVDLARRDDDPVAAFKARFRVGAVEAAAALLTAEAERDRRIGAAVMAALDGYGSDRFMDDNLLDDADTLEAMRFTMAPRLYRAIAAALREEAGR